MEERYWENTYNRHGNDGRWGKWELCCNKCNEENKYIIKKNKKTYCSSCGELMYKNEPIIIDLKCRFCETLILSIDEDETHGYINVCNSEECALKYIKCNKDDFFGKLKGKDDLFIKCEDNKNFKQNINVGKCNCYNTCKCNKLLNNWTFKHIDIEASILKLYDGYKYEKLKELFYSIEWNKEIFINKN